MVMSPSDALSVARSMIADATVERARLDEVDKWLSASSPLSGFRETHSSPDAEKNRLRELSYTPMLELIVTEVAQQMELEGVSTGGGDEDDARMFAPWERNGLLSRQFPLWKATVGYGLAHTLILPGEVISPDGSREDRAWISAFSPRHLHVRWNDPLEDEHPAYALRIIGEPGRAQYFRLYDDEAVYFFASDSMNGDLSFIEYREHGIGVCPVVQFNNDIDLEGRTPGDVDKYLVPARRYNKTTGDRILAQHYNSWKVRTATGLELDDDPEKRKQAKHKLAHDDTLVGGEGVEFGTLPETNLAGLIAAAEADRDTLAAVSQTPVWTLNGGQLANLSADALVEARSMQRLKVSQKKRSNGLSVARTLRLAAHVEGRVEDARNYNINARWGDVESRSLAQVADALGKMSQMLGIPPVLLLDMIPGLSGKRVKEWREYMESHPSERDRLAATLNRQLTSSAGDSVGTES